MLQGIPDKGAILTKLSQFWFQFLQSRIPNLRTHFISLGLSPTIKDQVPQEKFGDLEKRSMIGNVFMGSSSHLLHPSSSGETCQEACLDAQVGLWLNIIHLWECWLCSSTVKRLRVFPIESIVRGFITGSAWSSYKKNGTMHGMTLPEGYVSSIHWCHFRLL